MASSGTAKKYEILDQPNSKKRHMKVICAGAGATGLYLAYRIQKRMTNITFTIYEKNHDIGGTWLESMSLVLPSI